MALASESRFHILAVDDSLIDRKLIERLFKNSSFLVTTVDSGSKALKFLGLGEDQGSSSRSSELLEVEVNMVITDYCMPEMTGHDLLKKMKESSALKNIPVVIMSSENVPARINRCLEDGAEEFLLKPVKQSDMSRLTPHIMKGKYTEYLIKNNNNDDFSSSSSVDWDTTTSSTSDNINSSNGISSKRKQLMRG